MYSSRDAIDRRVATLGRHVVPRLEGQSTESLDCGQGVGLAPTASSSTYASATGRPTSYAQVHGEVSREPAVWSKAKVPQGELQDVVYQKTQDGIAKITINRPERRNAFRPRTIIEMSWCFEDARNDSDVGAIILTGAGELAFCSGGDQAVRGEGGYVGEDGTPRLNVLDLQVQIRRLPKPVVCMVAGYAVGGGHILHMVCDLTIAADNAVFGQTGPKASGFAFHYSHTLNVI